MQFRNNENGRKGEIRFEDVYELQTSFCSRIAFLNFPSQLLFVCYVINIASSFVPVHTDDYFIRGTALPGGAFF